MVFSLTGKTKIFGARSANGLSSEAGADDGTPKPNGSGMRSVMRGLKPRVRRTSPRSSAPGPSDRSEGFTGFQALPLELRQQVLRDAGAPAARNVAQTSKHMFSTVFSDPVLGPSIEKYHNILYALKSKDSFHLTVQTTAVADIQKAVQITTPTEFATLLGVVKDQIKGKDLDDQLGAAVVVGLLLGSGKLNDEDRQELANLIDRPPMQNAFRNNPIEYRSRLMSRALQALIDTESNGEKAFRPLLDKLKPYIPAGPMQILRRDEGYRDLLNMNWPDCLKNVSDEIKALIAAKLAVTAGS